VKGGFFRAALRLVFKDFGWKVLSLAIAVLLWAVVASEPELSTFVSVPVEYKSLPEGMEISSDVVESVYLELHGPSGRLRGGNGEERRYAVVLDMSSVRAGERTFTIGEDDVRLPRGIRLVRAIPSQLRFDFERRQYRSVPVEVRFAKQPQPGYEVAFCEVTPSTLQIVGPESRVNRTRHVATDPIDVSNAVGTAEFRVNAFVDDPHIRFTHPPQVKVKVHIKRKNG
jgi:YbbR domain-containing protein